MFPEEASVSKVVSVMPGAPPETVEDFRDFLNLSLSASEVKEHLSDPAASSSFLFQSIRAVYHAMSKDSTCDCGCIETMCDSECDDDKYHLFFVTVYTSFVLSKQIEVRFIIFIFVLLPSFRLLLSLRLRSSVAIAFLSPFNLISAHPSL